MNREPLLYTFSGQSPQNPTLDPILYAETARGSPNFEMTKMIGYGMPGVWTHAFVDMWSPGYLGFMSSNHNGMLRMYETMGNGGANTMRRNMQAEAVEAKVAAAAEAWWRWCCRRRTGGAERPARRLAARQRWTRSSRAAEAVVDAAAA